MTLATIRPLREAAKRLPAPLQLWLKRAEAAVGRSDWAGRLYDLRRREQAFIDRTINEARRIANRRRILVLGLQTPSPWSAIEGSLAMALQLRGHDVHGVLCDGLLPVCEMSLGGHDRPLCDVCVGWRRRYYEEAFGFDWPRLTDYLDSSDHRHAVEMVEATSHHELEALVVDGIGIGRYARRELQRYRRGFVFDAPADPMYRPWLVAGAMLVRLSDRLLDRERPDIVLASSGRTLTSACLTDVARKRGVRVVTWDTEPSHPDGLVFSHTRPAVEVPMDDIWPEVSSRPLSHAERGALHAFLGRWARSESTPFPYNPSPIEDEGVIRSRLGLRADLPVIVAFSNSAWDMAVVDRDVGFASMFHWLFALVDYARRCPSIQLVVRAHPAEATVPDDLRSRTPVGAELRARCAPLPPNVFIVDGNSSLSSYTLGRMAQVSMAYASRIGLELAIAGRLTWLAGDVTYRDKGFTRDIGSRDEMVNLLDARVFNERLSPERVERAERFAYTWFFRYIARLPLVRQPGTRFSLGTFQSLAPDGDACLDRICEALVTRRPFLDLTCN